MLYWKLIESRMVEWEGTAMETVKGEWNRLLQVGIDYWIDVKLQIKR